MKSCVQLLPLVLLAVFLRGADGQGLPNLIEFPADRPDVKIPLIRANTAMLAPVRINGRDAGLFLVDTGSSVVVVDPKIARELNLPPAGGSLDLKVEGGSRAPSIALDELQLGDVKLQNLFASEVDLSGVRERAGISAVHGIIGSRYCLGEMAFTLNWSEASLTLHKVKPKRGSEFVRLPIRLFGDLPAVNLGFEGRGQGWLILDSGGEGGVTFSSDFARSNQLWLRALPWRSMRSWTVSGVREERLATLAQLELGGLSFGPCALDYTLYAKSDVYYMADGGIGQDILNRLEITFDYQSGQVWIRQNPANGRPVEWGNPNFDVNSVDAAGVTPLMLAIKLGRVDDAKHFIATGARLDAEDGTGSTPLMSAAGAKSSEMAALLISAGVPVNTASHDQFTALIIAAGNGMEEVVKLLLDHGAKVDASDMFGRTPLIAAAENGNRAIVEMLIKAGSDLNAISPAAGTALNAAAANGRTDAAKLLMDAGADSNKTDRSRTPLIGQAAFGGSLELVRFLLDRGADPNAHNGSLQTPIFAAVVSGSPEIVDLFLEHGADPTIKDRDGKTAIQYPSLWGDLEIDRILYFSHRPTTAASRPAVEGTK